MKRPSYKKLYLKEKSKKGAYKNLFNSLLRAISKFDGIKVSDKKEHSMTSFTDVRVIEIKQNEENNFYIAIQDETDEEIEENEEYE